MGLLMSGYLTGLTVVEAAVSYGCEQGRNLCSRLQDIF